jgi:hypothetical protein
MHTRATCVRNCHISHLWVRIQTPVVTYDKANKVAQGHYVARMNVARPHVAPPNVARVNVARLNIARKKGRLRRNVAC